MPTATELPITTLDSGTIDAMDLATEIFDSSINITSATFFGDPRSVGIYTDGDTISEEATPGDTGVILSTGLVEDFTNNSGTLNTNTAGNTGTNTNGVNNDADFNALAGTNTNDAAFLEIEFEPVGDTITIDFVIASEEYPEWVNSQFLDTVGVWVNGVEAQVSVGSGTASVGNINGASTPNLYNDNTSDQFNTEMDGFTITLTFVAPVTPGTNTLKIGVADVSDSGYDTNLLIAGGSIQSTIIANDDTVALGNNDTKIVDVLDNDSSTGGTLSITHINGQTAVVGVPIPLGTGQTVALNADGTFTVVGDGDAETVYFNYSIQDTAGNTDTALVEITQTPCFAGGTRIDTPNGPRAIERLRVGDLVTTLDDGAVPIRWIGSTRVAATGPNVPVRISAGTFGATRDVTVSQNHRILVRDIWAELLFGEPEVLVAAKELVNHRTIKWDADRRWVTYFHILLDRHQMLQSEGLISESYHPGPQTLVGFDADTRAEMVRLFPALDHDLEAYGPAARLSLRAFEVPALLERIAA